MSEMAASASRALTWRFALREMRGGLRGFAVFIACIALGVAAIAGVGSFARSLGDGLAREGRVILGGDVAFSLMPREASVTERKFLDDNGRVSVAATLARDGTHRPTARARWSRSRPWTAAYPLFGAVVLDPPGNLADALAQRDGAFGAAADPALLARLNLQTGARVTIGGATIELRAALKNEPDKLAGGIGFGPRLLLSEAALRATGLIQPGSLMRWHYRLQLPAADANDTTANAVVAAAEKQLPDAGWEARTRQNASPALGRNIERFTQYLTLVGLTALLVGGVGVANAVKHYLDRRRNTIATLKSLGATGGRVFAIYLIEVMLLAAIGAAIGLVVGAILPFAISAAFSGVLPLPIEPAVHPGELALAVLYGFLTALAFALWPLGRAHDVPVSALYRDAVAPQRRMPRMRYVAATALVTGALAAIAVASRLRPQDRGDLHRGSGLRVSRAASCRSAHHGAGAPRPTPALRAAAARARQHPPPRRADAERGAVARARPRAARHVAADRRQLAPPVRGFASRQGAVGVLRRHPGRGRRALRCLRAEQTRRTRVYERVPMLRGRIVSAHGVRAEDLKAAPNAAWVAAERSRHHLFG